MLSFFFSSRRRHTRFSRDWSSDVCSSDLSPRHEPVKRTDRHLLAKTQYTQIQHSYGSDQQNKPNEMHVHHECPPRSEERRVGKECRSRWTPDHEKKKESINKESNGLDIQI